MLTKTIIISAFTVSAIGGTGLALTPQNPVESLAISAGPIVVTLGGEAPVSINGASQVETSVTVTLKSGRQISLSV